MEFKDRIKMLRDEQELSATKLAAEFGKTSTAVRMWESGKSKPDANTLIKLSRYFECSTDFLLGLPDQRTRIVKVKKSLASYSSSELLAEIKRRMEG